MKTSPPRHGFTLIELLTVMGLMVVMAGLFGVASRDSAAGTGLEAAQNIVAGIVGDARNRALLSPARTMIVVEADATRADFLRKLQVAVETAPDSDQWRLVDEGVELPPGVFVVPVRDGIGGAFLADGVNGSPAWPDSRTSSLVPAMVGSVGPIPPGSPGAYLRMVTAWTQQGFSDVNGGTRFVVASGRRAPAAVFFEQPQHVRGVVLSAYGLAILINDGPGFDF